MKALTEKQLRELLYEAYNKGYVEGSFDRLHDRWNEQHSLVNREAVINEMMTKV